MILSPPATVKLGRVEITGMELYADRIEVELEEEARPLASPNAFTWRGQRYGVVRVLRAWQDAGFADGGQRRHRWWERRHRNYFRVQTESGEIWDLYLDRGGGRQWYLSRRWEAGEGIGEGLR